MDEIAGMLPDLPHVVWVMIGSVVFIPIGGAVGAVLQRLTGRRWAPMVSIILASVIGYSGFDLIAAAQAHNHEAAVLTTGLVEIEPLKTLVRVDPSARSELEKRFVAAFRTAPPAQKIEAGRSTLARFIAERSAKYLLLAGSTEIHRLAVAELATLRALKGRPDACVGFHLGRGLADSRYIDGKLLGEVSAAKAAIIESAVTRPEAFAGPISEGRMLELLRKGAVGTGLDLAPLAGLSNISSLPAEEGCRIATDLAVIVAFLEPKEAAEIIKMGGAASAAPTAP